MSTQLLEITPLPTLYVRPGDAAKILCIGKSTLWNWVNSLPELPRPYRVGGRVTLWSVKELEAFVQAGRVPFGVHLPEDGHGDNNPGGTQE